MSELEMYLRSKCYGRDNAGKSKELERMFHCKGTEIRAQVNRLRCLGVPVCSNSKGYYYSIDENDIRMTIANLNSRISKIQEAMIGLQTTLIMKREETQHDNP